MSHFNPSKEFKTKNNTLFVGIYALFYYICKQIHEYEWKRTTKESSFNREILQ